MFYELSYTKLPKTVLKRVAFYNLENPDLTNITNVTNEPHTP